ncbi:TIGR04255 family protein [Oscillibacter sp.]|uniref:TIGR04255 family protein n=1 Tax=Oscillibacter sp. TaxID=1945593 RepID=UPI00262D9087|nr:TIGR04255 family protein [Oscillibacter sp.]MDD3347158.1 TIGR04255 family protein [Oscillibacter sp.]
MLFSNQPRAHYAHAPIHEVICQLRFPTILAINNVEPADFQEAVREAFPQYARRQDVAAPKISGLGGSDPHVEQQPPVTNYHFLSADGRWKLNLTRDFIALSTLTYPGWEEFAHHLDKPLASFIKIYQPAYFQRVGLRYVNIISRSALGLGKTPWAELIAPAYTGPLQEPDVTEENFLSCGCDLLFKLDSSCQSKIHAGPGRLQSSAPNAPQDPEMKFIFDMDLSMGGNTPCTLSAGALETLHAHATRIFEGAVSQRLRSAMEGV